MDTSAIDLSSQIHLKVEQPVQSDDVISKSLEKYDVKRDENVEMENHSKVEGNPEQISECGIINSNDNINNNNTCSNDVGVVVKKRNPKGRNSPKESKVFQCTKCHSCYTSRTFLKIHIQRVHKGITYPCSQCGKVFSREYSLRLHKCIVNQPEKQRLPIACFLAVISSSHPLSSPCGRFFQSQTIYMQTASVQSKSAVISCLVSLCSCFLLMTKTWDVNIDANCCLPILASRQLSPKSTKFPCTHCSRTFPFQYLLNRHIKIVHEGKPFPCEQCDIKFASKANLSRHVAAIHQGMKFTCDLCDKKFSTKNARARHIKSIHEGMKFTCDLCDKKFSTKSASDRHIKTVHEGKKFFCDQCDRKFYGKSKLREHIQVVHEGKPFPCEQCDKKFSSKANLSRHVAAIHQA
uniref:C2H2-type domain-containing protein n=1 Tax=Trichobilharzia regenti TaxID=157069 RepID=A0AA85IXR1_TRIRE|nr:unnamed protein product [Trichobilharzia regenti]